MPALSPTELRARFALRLSSLYGSEVPAYRTLVDVAGEVNRHVVERDGASAERLGDISRVTAERHGAIRVGTPRELAQVARVFRALGMHPVGFYDLRDAEPRPIPVVSTAFRPIDREELAANPFRMFTSMLVPEDRRFFTPELEARLTTFLDRRELFPPELLVLADRAAAADGLDVEDGTRFLDLAVSAFELSAEPVDRAWYAELEAVSSVAADIGGVTSTHINHLTPRVLDIDELYGRMRDRGIEMIEAIQGPPRFDGPDVLLRQTSFRALAEPRAFRDPSGQVSEGSLRVRFGEVEARGIALTFDGRDRYDSLVAQADVAVRDSGADRSTALADAWNAGMPRTELDLWRDGLAFFTYTPTDRPGIAPRAPLAQLVADGWVDLEPIVYEDFLPRSAAGIFSSNLSGPGQEAGEVDGVHRDIGWLSDVVGTEIRLPESIYAQESAQSLVALARLVPVEEHA